MLYLLLSAAASWGQGEVLILVPLETGLPPLIVACWIHFHYDGMLGGQQVAEEGEDLLLQVLALVAHKGPPTIEHIW